MNRALLYVISILVVLGFIGYLTSLSAWLTANAELFITTAERLGILFMLINGTFVNSPLFKVAFFLLALIVLGALFKILHYPGADELLLYPPIMLFCLYLIHFFRKKPKRRMDVLKVFVLLSVLWPLLIVLHLISNEYREPLVIASYILFWITFLDFLYQSHSQGVLLRK